MNDELDLIELKSIILEPWAIRGDNSTIDSNELIMKS